MPVFRQVLALSFVTLVACSEAVTSQRHGQTGDERQGQETLVGPLTLTTPAASCGILASGEGLSLASGGKASMPSCDGAYSLTLQSDGNLVMYHGSTALWSSQTYGTTPGQAVMQTDGNFVVYDGQGTAQWASHTYANNNGAHLAVQTDGNVVVYGTGGNAPWSSFGGPLSLPLTWNTNPNFQGSGYTNANGLGGEAPMAGYGSTLFLGNAKQIPWNVYLANINDQAHTAECHPFDNSSPKVESWGQFQNNSKNDAAQVLNLCLEGLYAAGGSGWTLEIPTMGLGDPVYFIASQLLVQHPVTLQTAYQTPGDTTSCYHTATEHHDPTLAGTRNWGGGIYWNGSAWATYNQGNACVHLVAAPCDHCGLPSPQFFNVDPNDPNAHPETYPKGANPTNPQSVLVNHGLNGGGFVLVGKPDFSEVNHINLRNLIFDGNRDNRNVEGQCYYHKYFGTQNLAMIHCRDCQLMGSASINNLCGANVQLDMVGGAVDFNTVAFSGDDTSELYGEQQSDGLSSWSINGVDVGVNTLMDATDGNSYFAANHAKFHDNLVTNANPASPKGLNHSGFNFNAQGGTRFGTADVVPGDFKNLQVYGNRIIGNYRYDTTVGGSNFHGSKFGIELGSLPWSTGISSDFTGATFWNNLMTDVILGYSLDGVGIIGDTTGNSFPNLCNGALANDGTCIKASPSQISTITIQSTNPGQPTTYVPSGWNFGPTGAELNTCHVVHNYPRNSFLTSFNTTSAFIGDGSDANTDCGSGPY